MESKETQAKQKKDQLFMKSKHGATRISAETQKQSDAFAADYMAFLNASKTEREAAKNAAALLEEKGFVDAIAHRWEMKKTLAHILKLHQEEELENDGL